MKTLAILLVGAALICFTMPALFADADSDDPVLVAKKDKDKDKDKKEDEKKKEGGSKFGDDDEDEKEGEKKKDEVPDKPVPKTLSTHDYRLDFKLEDSRFWKIDNNYTAEEEKQGVCIKMILKLPKSDDHFDVNVFCQAIEHKMTLNFKDGTKIGASNYKGIADKHFEGDIKEWTSIKNKVKPKNTKLSRDLGKVITYSFTGLMPGNKFPLHKVRYYFKFKAKTYILTVMYTTTSYKNKAVTGAVDKMLKSFKERKKKR